MNEAKISGSISNIETSHVICGKKFYSFLISSKRASGVRDTVRCIVSDDLISEIRENDKIIIFGKLRTRNISMNGKRKLAIYVEVDAVAEYTSDCEDVNDVVFDGFICKTPIHRMTPLGREISDVILAHNRSDGNNADYMPCIAWSKNASRVAELEVGTRLEVRGRLQSREYLKRLADGKEMRTAYELSISKMRKETTPCLS